MLFSALEVRRTQSLKSPVCFLTFCRTLEGVAAFIKDFDGEHKVARMLLPHSKCQSLRLFEDGLDAALADFSVRISVFIPLRLFLQGTEYEDGLKVPSACDDWKRSTQARTQPRCASQCDRSSPKEARGILEIQSVERSQSRSWINMLQRCLSLLSPYAGSQ